MQGPVRITPPLLDVLEVLLAALEDDRELHGWAIMKAVARSGPTVYGVLDRLEDAGWLGGRWENENPEPSRPRRRLYRLTPQGVTSARELLLIRRGSQRIRKGHVPKLSFEPIATLRHVAWWPR
jgi:DNA-binding PadR family transcriptional regulator